MSNEVMEEKTVVNPPQEKVSKKKAKKRKPVWLIFPATIILVVGLIILNDVLVEKKLKEVAASYPFIMTNPLNSMGYVTDDFTVMTAYADENKEYNVKWESNSDCIQIDENGNATVKRAEENQKVRLTQTYRKWFGKASIDYELNVIGTKSLKAEEVELVTLDSLRNDEYNRDMEAVLNPDGSLQYMIGDFKNTYVNSDADAMAIVEAYREQFGVDENVTFHLKDIVPTSSAINYLFNAYYNDIEIDNSSVLVISDLQTNMLNKISMCISSVSEAEIVETTEVSEDVLIEGLTAYLNAQQPNSSIIFEPISIEEYEIENKGCTINENGIIQNYAVWLSSFDCYNIKVQNNEILEIRLYNDNIGWNYEHTKAKGVNEKNELLEFNASIDSKGTYYLIDKKRNIRVTRAIWDYRLYQKSRELLDNGHDTTGAIVGLGGLLEILIANNIVEDVESVTGFFGKTDAIQTETYANAQKAYDFYYDNFDRLSYDNKGSNVNIITGFEPQTDNAGWCDMYKVMYISPKVSGLYSPAVNQEVITHEYTHAVFSSIALGSSIEVGGIEEAYCDIMGCLSAPESDWTVGANVYANDIINTDGTITWKKGDAYVIRDLKDPNSKLNEYGVEYPEKYKDQRWNDCHQEPHAISVMLSNVAYRMDVSEHFESTDVAQIWMKSMEKGYDANSTYVSCRRSVLKSAAEYGCQPEDLDFIARCFDDIEVYDGTYTYSSDRYKPENPNNETSDGTTVLKTVSEAVEGDRILDDTTTRRYLLIYSPGEVFLGDPKITIYEERLEGEAKVSEEEMTEKIAKLFNDKYGKVLPEGRKITVEYRFMETKKFDKAAEVSSNALEIVIDTIFQTTEFLGISLDATVKDSITDFTEKFLPIMYEQKVYEVTAYEFYDKMGVIN